MKLNLAARAGRWSAAHWKTATFGWLAFVVAAVLIGGAIGTKTLGDGDSPGESGRMTKILDEGGSTYVMERQLPSGRAVNDLEVVARERPRAFGVRTTSGPTPFVYRYRLSSRNGETLMQLDAKVELPGVAELVPLLARRAVRSGVDDNFATLKRILEVQPPGA